VVVWHAQLEEGTVPTGVIPDATTFTSRASTTTFIDATGTLQTAAIDVARDDAYGYVDGVLKPIGLLLEGAATNLLLSSNQFSGAGWKSTSNDIFINFAKAPDGSNTASKIVKNSSYGYCAQISNYGAGVYRKSKLRNYRKWL